MPVIINFIYLFSSNPSMIAFYVTRRLNKLKKVNSNLLIPKAEHIMDKKIEKLLEEIGL